MGVDAQRMKRAHALWFSGSRRNIDLSTHITRLDSLSVLTSGDAMDTDSLPEISRQVRFPEIGRVELTRTPIPQIGHDDMLVRIARVGICATDLHLLAGHIGDPFPLVPGHEFVGEIAEIGPSARQARNLQVGDHVAIEMLIPCQTCARCREGRYNLCDRDDMFRGWDRGRQYGVNIPQTVSPGLWGGYADYVFVPEAAITHKLPSSLPWDIAALVEPLAVVYRAFQRGRIQAGETVAIIGPGPIGILATAAARSIGAGRVVVLGTRQSRLDLALKFGADAVINSRVEDVETRFREELGGLADIVVEAAGVPAAQEQAIRLTRRGGRAVLTGACGSGVPVTFRQDEDVLLKELDILPSFLSAGGFEPAITTLERRDFPYEKLVTHIFPLEEVETAFQVIQDREGGVLKALLDPTAS